ncbi:hypothetical protein QNI16_10165 [Cytophagaceae bacterium YF14B1]|uniref:Uncharacterized protein n=1 Tax=Xanthocytophaga flava TaxID=3048013 RepID=A0AAE3QK48_9BACT|nr:hypothetical protein [Xanthocytophaga flavus]MDJ1480847.1 hypothetical protein [Xanthocytophaga flavus]
MRKEQAGVEKLLPKECTETLLPYKVYSGLPAILHFRGIGKEDTQAEGID